MIRNVTEAKKLIHDRFKCTWKEAERLAKAALSELDDDIYVDEPNTTPAYRDAEVLLVAKAHR